MVLSPTLVQPAGHTYTQSRVEEGFIMLTVRKGEERNTHTQTYLHTHHSLTHTRTHTSTPSSLLTSPCSSVNLNAFTRRRTSSTLRDTGASFYSE
jgi:hypothetical protein